MFSIFTKTLNLIFSIGRQIYSIFFFFFFTGKIKWNVSLHQKTHEWFYINDIKLYGHKVQILLQMEKKKVSLTHRIDDRNFHKKLKNILFILGLKEEKKKLL